MRLRCTAVQAQGRKDNEAAMHGDAGAKREERRGTKGGEKGKKVKKEKNEWGKQATEVPSPLEVVLTRPHSAISARAGAMGARWGM